MKYRAFEVPITSLGQRTIPLTPSFRRLVSEGHVPQVYVDSREVAPAEITPDAIVLPGPQRVGGRVVVVITENPPGASVGSL